MVYWSIAQSNAQKALNFDSISSGFISFIFVGIQCAMIFGYTKVQMSLAVDLLKKTNLVHDMKDELN